MEFLKKISELPSPENPHDIKIRKTQNEKIGKGFKEAKTAFELLDANARLVRGQFGSTRGHDKRGFFQRSPNEVFKNENPLIKRLQSKYFDKAYVTYCMSDTVSHI